MLVSRSCWRCDPRDARRVRRLTSWGLRGAWLRPVCGPHAVDYGSSIVGQDGIAFIAAREYMTVAAAAATVDGLTRLRPQTGDLYETLLNALEEVEVVAVE